MLHDVKAPNGRPTSSLVTRLAATASAPAAPLVVAQFSTRLPLELLERLRIAAPQLRMRQAEITAAALHNFLSRHGF